MHSAVVQLAISAPVLPSGFGGAPGRKVEHVTGAEDMQTHIVQRENPVGLGFSDVGAGGTLTIDDVDCATPDHPEPGATYNDRGILVDADAEHPGVLGYGPEQATDAA